MGAKKTQVLLVCGALILSVLLFIAPKIAPPFNSEEKGNKAIPGIKADNNASLNVFLNLALKNLSPELNKSVQKLQTQKKVDSLIVFWDKLKRPDLASYYTEETAKNKNTQEDWYKTGNRYYYSIRFTEDKTESPLLYQCAMRCFSKCLKLNPKNTDAKIMLASCFVEGTPNPMEGISMLKEIEKTDSNNVKLQLCFAFFSVKSGQLDKAIVRFNKVLQTDSNYIEAYLHLADAYEQTGDNLKTIQMLEKYSARTSDPAAKAEINKYIQQLKK